jgi:hypothetical protein
MILNGYFPGITRKNWRCNVFCQRFTLINTFKIGWNRGALILEHPNTLMLPYSQCLLRKEEAPYSLKRSLTLSRGPLFLLKLATHISKCKSISTNIGKDFFFIKSYSCSVKMTKNVVIILSHMPIHLSPIQYIRHLPSSIFFGEDFNKPI